MKKGFTLIELLVVVLIIGILAAVALPQYQKAVEKSRATQALTLLKSVYQTAIAYQLANGEWPSSFGEMAMDISWTGNTPWNSEGVADTVSNEYWSLQIVKTSSVSGLTIGRISGPYAGSGFAIFKEHPYDNIPKEQILCEERHSQGIAFEGQAGSYCRKIMNGTGSYVGASTWADVYILP